MIEGGNPWWVVLIAALPSAGSGIWVFWRWWAERGDKKEDTALSRQERATQMTDARMSDIARRDAERITGLELRISILEGTRGRTEFERDRGWDLARWWNAECFRTWHLWTNASQMADNAMRQAGLMPPVWPVSNLPQFEAPYPPAPAREG